MDLINEDRKATESPKNYVPHGIEKYLAEQERKRAEHENIFLQNRINKLAREEENAKKKFLISIQRAKDLSRLKDQHVSTLQEKFNYKMKKKEEEDLMRIKLNDIKRQRKEKMKKLNDDVMKQKHNQAKEIKNTKKFYEDMYKEYLQMVHQENFRKALHHKETKMKSSTERSKSIFDQKNSLKEDYLKIIDEHKNEYLKAINHRSNLIKIEEELLKRLSDTKDRMKTFDSMNGHYRSFSTPGERDFSQ